MTNVAPGGRAVDLAALRSTYAAGGLTEADVAADPLVQLGVWLQEAVAAELPEPNAMVVATVDADGQPSARTVLRKGLDDRGLVFFTNLLSRKGRAIAANPRVGLLFPWHVLQRQVRVDGSITVVDREENDGTAALAARGAIVESLATRREIVAAA